MNVNRWIMGLGTACILWPQGSIKQVRMPNYAPQQGVINAITVYDDVRIVDYRCCAAHRAIPENTGFHTRRAIEHAGSGGRWFGSSNALQLR